ncbi:MAG: GNAT family N-acetyltransferase [Nanoarchaeota archaeon]
MEKIKPIIRKAKLIDINSIYNLGRKTKELNFSPKMSFHDKAELMEFIKKPRYNILLVATFEKNVVGFLYAKIVSHSWCLLDNIAVDEKYRNHGIGNLLMHELYHELKNVRVHYVQVLEEIHHKKTREFWKKKGFKEEKVFVWADREI